MSYLRYQPYVTKDVITTASPQTELWQELTLIRYIEGSHAQWGRKVTAPFIDQAKTYYLDASNSDWRSAGLLYYYSFLNLAKAYIVLKRATSAKSLKSTKAYHGISAEPQSPSKIVDYRVKIHPPKRGSGSQNIFTQFYEKLTNQTWPFNSVLTIPLSTVLPYCDDLAHELGLFYNISRASLQFQMLLRHNATHTWTDILVPDGRGAVIQSVAPQIYHSTINFLAMTPSDKQVWEHADPYMSIAVLSHYEIVRLSHLPFTPANHSQQMQTSMNQVQQAISTYTLPLASANPSYNHFWNFIPPLAINGQRLNWHPILTNYLFAFALGNILRYHPHLLTPNRKNAFFSELWCNQSPITTLRYMLMKFTNPPIRVN